MKEHFYFETSRRTIIQFLNLFNNIRIARYDVHTGKLLKFISVPLKFAPKEKHWWWKEKVNTSTGKTIREVTLPHIAVIMTGIDLDNDRITNKHFKVRSERGHVSPIWHKKFDNPVPYTFNFEVQIAAQFMIDVNQILEQILPFFDPTAYIRITIPELHIDHPESDEEEGAFPLDLKVVYEGGQWETNIDMGSDEYRIIKWVLNFKVESYMFKPNMEEPVIEHALVDYYDSWNYEYTTSLGLSAQPLIETTLTGLSAEKWPVTISGGVSGLPSGALYSDTAKLWYTYESEQD